MKTLYLNRVDRYCFHEPPPDFQLGTSRLDAACVVTLKEGISRLYHKHNSGIRIRSNMSEHPHPSEPPLILLLPLHRT